MTPFMPLRPGTRLGSYEVIGVIGAGGMGEVFKATDLSLGREVALKILPREFTEDPDWRRRFEREARLLASFSHATYDVAADGRFVFVEGDDQSQLRNTMYVVVNWFEELKRRVPSPHGRR